MRLLFLALSMAVVTSQSPPKKAPKMPVNCVDVLGNFTMYRDACLNPLGLSDWVVFPTDSPTMAPVTLPPSTSAPVTGTPTTASPTGTPTTGTPTTGTPTTLAPIGTGAPTTGSPTPSPTPTPAMAACAPAGECRSFINWADMWRKQIDMCLRDAAMGQVDPMAMQTTSELRYATMLVNKGCSMNEWGDLCAESGIPQIKAAGCPDTQTMVDDWVDAYGCCVGTYAELSMVRAELIEEAPCEGEFEIGKACKAPKWKLPKKAAEKAASMGKKGKIAGGVVGGVVGLSIIGLALRKRRAKLSVSKPQQKSTGQVAMVSVPVAV